MSNDLACAFPGQGIQKPGMVKELLDTPVWELFSKASAILGYDLGKLCLEGPSEELNKTSKAQPAVFVTCFALWELYKQYYQPSYLLGHSLGEITALAAAGAFSFEDGVRLVAARGYYMEQVAEGGMAAVLGLTATEVAILCEEISSRGQNNYVQVANENSPGQTVVSGLTEGLELLAKEALVKGARRVIKLNVSGPFHSKLMQDASEEFAAFLGEFPVNPCAIPVLSNDGKTLVLEKEDIQKRLAKQITSPVYFVDSVELLYQLGVRHLVEIAPEMVVIPMARRTEPKLHFSLVREGGI